MTFTFNSFCPYVVFETIPYGSHKQNYVKPIEPQLLRIIFPKMYITVKCVKSQNYQSLFTGWF